MKVCPIWVANNSFLYTDDINFEPVLKTCTEYLPKDLYMSLAILAQAAVNFFLGKTIEGALTSIGTDAYKAASTRLKGFLTYKFADTTELEKAPENPQKFVALVEDKASKEEDFRQELEKLVNQIQEAIKTTPTATNTYSNVGDVSNQNIGSVSGSTVGGRDAVGRDQNNVGGNQTNFRQQDNK